MRVFLALPPGVHDLEIYRITDMNAPPLGLAYIASVLEGEGHRVRILDSPTLRIDDEGFMAEVRSFSPDVIGLSVQTPMALRAYRVVRMVKEEYPDVPVILGGPHPTYMYEEALDAGADVVVRGELTTAELLRVIEERGVDPEALRRVKGIAFRDGGRTVVTEDRPLIADLDTLPDPARHLLPMDRYTLFGKPIRLAHVMASRGCPYGCIYCITSYFWGRRIRFRSPERVAAEIEELVEKYRANRVVFTDDELVVNRRFVHGLIEALGERGLDIEFACGARVDHVSKDFLKFLFDSGCIALYFGVESASQSTLDRIGKRIRTEQAERVFRWVKELGGFAAGSFILGFPWETLEDMRETVQFAIKLDPAYAQFTVLTPYPGTPLYRMAEEQGLIVDRKREHYTTIRPVMRGLHFTAKQLGRMLLYAYRRFYLRASFLFREFRAGRLGDLLRVLFRSLGPRILKPIRP